MTSPIEYNEHDLEILARTIYGEARGEASIGQTAVAWVIRNRSQSTRFVPGLQKKPGAVSYVCLKPYQFSCWLVGDPNLPKMMKLDLTADGASYAAIGRAVLDGQVADPTNGADHYYVTDMPDPPAWRDQMKVAAVIGHHTFLDSKQGV